MFKSTGFFEECDVFQNVMSLDPDTFRAALGRFASGVTVVTTRDAYDRDYGMTVSAFASLSLTPPLVLVCIDHTASMHTVITTGDVFVVNILSEHQEALARRFASPEAHRFDGVGYTRGLQDVPLLDDALALFECRRVTSYDAGDHTIVIGEIETATLSDQKPLLYYRGGFAQLDR